MGGYDGGAGWILRRDNGNDDIEFRTLGPGGDDMQTDFEPVSGEWVHVVATYAPNAVTVADGVKRIYINGEFDNDDVDDYEHPDLSTFDLYIGAQVDSNNITAGNFWRGMIDDVRLYTKALSPAEVWDLYRVNKALAWRPNPRNGETGVAIDPNLSWTPGDYALGANGHNVYLGADDPGSMVLLTIPAQPQTANSVTVGPLALGTTYYWAVGEVNDGGEDIGSSAPWYPWSFTVTNHLVVDDMDSYTPWNITDNNMWQVWMDGAGDCPGTNNTNSGAILYEETGTIYDGTGSMKYVYDNDGTVQTHPCPGGDPLTRPKYSRAVAKIADLPSGIDSNWLAAGAKALALRFYGSDVWFNDPNEKMWVELTDDSGKSAKVTYGPPHRAEDDINDVVDEQWHQWNIDLQEFVDNNSVNLGEVNSIAIGFGDPSVTPSPGWGYGTMYIDDIWLYATRCVFNKRDPDFAKADYTQDCVVDAEELDVMFGDWLETDSNGPAGELLVHWAFDDGPGATTAADSSGNGRTGAITGAVWDAGNTCLDFNNGDFVLDNDANAYMNGLESLTVALWVKSKETGTNNGFLIFEDPAGDNRGYRYDSEGSDGGGTNVIKCGVHTTDGRQQYESASSVQTTSWQHIAVTWSSGNEIKMYINGIEDTETDQESPRGGTLTGYTKLLVGKGGKDEGATEGWNGLIDDVRIYSYVLTVDEIITVRDGGTPAPRYMYYPLVSPANVYPKAAGDEGVYNPANVDIINFKDYALVAERWLDKDMFPPEGPDD